MLMYVYMYIFMLVCKCIYLGLYVYLFMFICVYVYAGVCIHIYVYVGVYMCIVRFVWCGVYCECGVLTAMCEVWGVQCSACLWSVWCARNLAPCVHYKSHIVLHTHTHTLLAHFPQQKPHTL